MICYETDKLSKNSCENSVNHMQSLHFYLYLCIR